MNYFKVLVLSLLIGVLGFITIYSLGEKNTKHNRTIKFENKINTVGYNDKLRSGADSELINIQCEKEKKIIVLIGQSLAGNNGPIVEKIKKSGTNFYNFNCYEMLNYAYGTGPKQSNAKLRENISYYISKKLINSDEFIWITAAWDGTSVIEWGMVRVG